MRRAIKIIGWTLILLGLTSTGLAKDKVSPFVLDASIAMDWASSSGLHEVNPVLGQSRTRQIAFQAALGIGINYATHRISKRHPHKATVINLGIAATHFFGAAHNWSVIGP